MMVLKSVSSWDVIAFNDPLYATCVLKTQFFIKISQKSERAFNTSLISIFLLINKISRQIASQF